QEIGDADEVRSLLRAGPIRAVASLALALIDDLARREIGVAAASLSRPQEAQNPGIVLADDIDDAALGLGSGRPEERTAVAARDVDGVDEINRREQALITCTAHVLAELLALLRRDVRIRIDVVFREC